MSRWESAEPPWRQSPEVSWLPMAVTIGVNCTSQFAFVAVVVDGIVVDREPARLELPSFEASERLSVFVDDTAHDLEAFHASHLSVLRAEQPPPGVRVGTAPIYSRAVLETLVRLAAVKAGLAIEMTSRKSLRSRLGLPMDGRLEEHLAEVLPSPVGRYWNAGRALAAMTALAAERA